MKRLSGTASIVIWLVVAVVALGSLVFASVRDPGPQTPADRVSAIARTVRCPSCAGETAAESNAATAREIRTEIAVQVADGRTDQEIRDFFAARYGEEILLTPSGSGLTSLIWIVPVVVLALGALVVVAMLRRPRTSLPAPDEEAVAAVGEARRGFSAGGR